MLTAMNDCLTCVALIVALAAAVISSPGKPAGTVQVLEWVQIGGCSEVNMLAGAIGETSAGCPTP